MCAVLTAAQVAIQMLGGFYGELVGPDQSGGLRWRPLEAPGLAAEALKGTLQQLADLGSLLQDLGTVC